MPLKYDFLRYAAMLGFVCSLGSGANILRAQEADKPPAAKSEADAKEAPPEEEAVETLEKKPAKPEPAEPAAKPAADKTEVPEKAQPAAAKPKSSVSDQLLEGLGLQGDEAAGNPLDAIVERMRTVQQRLQKTETDQQTRQLQTRIVKDLDDLIEKLKNQKPPPPSPNQGQPPPSPQSDSQPESQPRGGSQPRPQNSQKQRSGEESQKRQEQQKQQQKQQEAAAEQQSKGKSRDSDNQLRQGRSVEEEAARQRMAKDVWGHLPASLRQELLNVYSEKFLPKYDEMVRKYYEALAEQNRNNP